MPDKRTHRGANPADAKLFSAKQIEPLHLAGSDLSLLLTKGYATNSALKLVGDRFGLTKRQRMALMRSCCSDEQLKSRQQRQILPSQLGSSNIAIDGYNLLITIESALGGGFLFIGRDGCLRDLAGLHGTYRKVNETIPAIELIGSRLDRIGVAEVLWLIDRPVSNSGRLRQIMLDVAQKHGWLWNVELAMNPDKELCNTDMIVVSSDSVVLDKCCRWTNLAADIIENMTGNISIVDLSL